MSAAPDYLDMARTFLNNEGVYGGGYREPLATALAALLKRVAEEAEAASVDRIARNIVRLGKENP